MPRGRWCLGFALLALASSAISWGQSGLPPQHQPHFTKWTVGFSRHVRNLRWAPVHVVIKNPGPATNVDISIYGQDESGTQLPMVIQAGLHLPANAIRSHTFYMRFVDCDKLFFKLIEGGRQSHEVKETPLYVGRSDTLLMAVAYSQQSFGCQQQVAVRSGHGRILFNNTMQFKDLPSRWQGYEAVDVIVLGPLPPEGLTVTQERAIVDWVRAGGLLIVSPGNNAARYEGTLFESIIPCRILGKRLVESLPPIEATYGKMKPFKDRIGVSEVEPVRGTIHYRMGQLPLVISRPEGTGRVVFVAFDLASERLTAWPELWRLYRDLIDRRGSLPKPSVTPLPQASARLLYERVGIPVLPRAALACCLGVNFIFVLGMLLVLRKYRVRAFAVLLAAAPAFAIAINLIGGAIAGVEGPNVAGYQFVSTASGQPDASGVGFYALLSPKPANNCHVTHKDDPSAFPESLTITARDARNRRTAAETMQASYKFADEDLKWLKGVDVRPLAPATFQSSFLATLPGVVETRAVIGAEGVLLRVENRSPMTLRECFVAMNRNAASIKDLNPGQSLEVRLDRSTSQHMMARFARGAIRSRDEQLVNALYKPFRINDVTDTGALLGGWFDGEALPLEIAGVSGKLQTKYRSFWVVRGDIAVEPNASRVLLPKGTLAMHFTQPRASFVSNGEWQPIHGRTAIEVDFRVPDVVQFMKASRIELFLSTIKHPARAGVEAYNWRSGKYDVVFGEVKENPLRPDDTILTEPLGSGLLKLRIPDPEQYLSSRTGEVKIRATLEADGPTTLARRPEIEDFDLEIEGTLE